MKRCIRDAGLLLVTLDSIDDAVHVLRQFRAGSVVLHADHSPDDRARVISTGSPIVLVLHSTSSDMVQHYLSAGCAAVVAETCPGHTMATLLRGVAAGARQVVWPELVTT
jgi:hypothetical protein